MINNKIIKQYLKKSKQLTPLFGNKYTPGKDWPNRLFDDNDILSHSGNVGWVIGKGDLVVDVDPRNGGTESYAKLLKNLKINLEPTVNTPRGGFHIYLSLPEKYTGKQFKKTLNKEYPGIDFLTKGAYCLICGCSKKQGPYVWADDISGEFEQTIAPNNLIHLLSYETENSQLGDFDGLLGGESSNWSEDKVLAMMEKLDASMPNDEWVKVGMALHDWDPVKGLDVWEDWSKEGDNYNEGDTEVRWRSFDIGGGVTLGTISYMVKEVNYDEAIEKVNDYIEQIKFADEKKIEFNILPNIREEELSKINREKLVKAIQDRFKDLSGIRMPIGNIRRMITPMDIVRGSFVEDGKIPFWCKHWVYVNSHAGFIDMKTLKLHKSESFNVENGKFVPMSEGGTKPSATKFVSDRGHVDKVDAIAYLPTYDETICTIDGSTVLNSFNPKTVPIEAKEYSKSGQKAIELVKKHIKFICSTDKDSDIFTQWLAHQIQYPGRQVLWSPVVQSIQGVGKSFFGELLRSCLGDRNVGTVSPSQVVNEFNGWATNVVVNILEELRVKGHNRYDAVNALKPLITDRMIQINDKGVKQYTTYNTTNYMCFTNYKDALPLDGDDRRWWVIFVPIQSLKNMVDFVGESAITYFPKLFNIVRNNGQELRKWFMEYEITSDFMNIKQAPMTQHKESMIATEDAGFEGLSEVKELIKKGGKYFNEEVISSSDLFEALLFEHPEIEVQTTKRNILLKKLGYMILPKPIKLDGKSRRVWSKTQIPNNEVRTLLLEYSEDVDDL